MNSFALPDEPGESGGEEEGGTQRIMNRHGQRRFALGPVPGQASPPSGGEAVKR